MAADAFGEAMGALVPFTSPALTGARVAAASDGALFLKLAGIDAPPDWDRLAEEPRITLHDRLLMRRLAADPTRTPTPRRVAAAALASALSGAAGRVARRAAAMTAQQMDEDRLIAQFLQVVRLLEELGLEGMDWRHLSPSDPAFYDWLAASAARLAPALEPGTHDDGSELAAWLEELADVASPVGLPGDEYAPASAQALENLAGLIDGLRDFAACAECDSEAGASAARLADLGSRAAEAAHDAVRECHALLSDLCALRRDWASLGPLLRARCDKLDWALDGWAAARLIWSEAAENAARTAALGDMERLLGLCPAESLEAALADPASVDKIYRNELLKAAAA